VPVVAASGPDDCFEVAIEAVRVALRHMTPVFLLTDGYIQNAAGPWLIPDIDKFEKIETNPPPAIPASGDQTDIKRAIWMRNPETHGRPWVHPGLEGLAYRVGGIEKDIVTGDISYDAVNHQKMTDLRFAKVASVAKFIPKQTVEQGPASGALAVVGWGSTHGPIWRAVEAARADGLDISQIHIRWLNPFPENLGDLLRGYDRILVPEMNMGQLATVLRDRLEVPVESLTKVTGQPFKISEILEAIRAHARVAKAAE
jgi:2-oxoglutarate ferredoxin oxidoreductase subunit alpha